MLKNTPEHTAFCKQVVRDWLGDDGLVRNPEPVTASEDFAFFLEKVPGCYINIGNGVGSQGGCMVHNAAYDFNDPTMTLDKIAQGSAGPVSLATLGGDKALATEVQQRLAEAGLLEPPADGQFGPISQGAMDADVPAVPA